MTIKIGQITGADIIINDVDVAGRVASLDLDGVGLTEIEHASLGMIGVIKLPGRPIQAITAKIKFEWLDEEIEREMINPVERQKIQLHSNVDVFGPDGLDVEASHTLVTHLGYHFMGGSGFSAKLGEMTGVEHAITVPSFSQKVYGSATPVQEIDVFNGIYNVNGAPVFPT